jgi:ATP-dependent Clp protease protease subunit
VKVIYNIPPELHNIEIPLQPVVITVNDFTEESAKEFTELMGMAHNTGQKVIPIEISSYGGEVYALMSMIADINAAELPVATIVKGKAMSCGAILSTFGAEGMRYADSDATFMIHEVSLGAFGKTEEVTASAEEGRRLNEKVLKMMARNCGQDESYFIDQIHDRKHADWFLTADEAHQIGMVNHVRVPKMQVDIDVKWSFK